MCVRPACYLPPSGEALRARRLTRAGKAAVELACIALFLAAVLIWSWHASVRFA